MALCRNRALLTRHTGLFLFLLVLDFSVQIKKSGLFILIVTLILPKPQLLLPLPITQQRQILATLSRSLCRVLPWLRRQCPIFVISGRFFLCGFEINFDLAKVLISHEVLDVLLWLLPRSVGPQHIILPEPIRILMLNRLHLVQNIAS